MEWQAFRPSSENSRSRSLGPPSRGSALNSPAADEAHIPCLLREAVEAMLNPSKQRSDGRYDGIYVDCTFGRGGHSREILTHLGPKARLFAFDVDPEAVDVARELEREDPRFRILHRPFGDLAETFEGENCLDGILVDLGVSSPQLDDHNRGFNLWDSREPDMRMNQSAGVPAHHWLMNASVEELAWTIHAYGEDDDAFHAERIAEYIALKRREGSLGSNKKLAAVVKQAKNGCEEHYHPAKLTFQAIRVFINQEMQQLDRLLHAALEKLAFGGKLAVITFKKKEANAVRKFQREHEEPDDYLARTLDARRLGELFPLLLTKKPFAVEQAGDVTRASMQEVTRNWRSRSSAVHALVKVPRRHSVLAAAPRPFSERFREPEPPCAFSGSADPPRVDVAHLEPLAEPEPPAPAARRPTGPDPLGDPWATFQRQQSPAAPDSSPARQEASSEEEEPPPPVSSQADAPPPPRTAPPRLAAAEPLLREGQPRGTVVTELFLARALRRYDIGVKGYLHLEAGTVVSVVYQGTEGEELGWSYGLDQERLFGWFPNDIVAPIRPDEAG